MGKLILRLIVFLAFLPFILELSVRLFLPQQLIVYDNFYVSDYSGLGVKPAPNLDIIVNTGEGDARLLTDDMGYRVGEQQPKHPESRVLAIGDSYLFAMQVDYEQTMTALLEWRLTEELGSSVMIVNTGNAGSDVNHYRILMEQELQRQEYDMVLLFINSSNDYIDKKISYFEPRTARQRLLRMPRAASIAEFTDALLYPINDWLERSSHLFILAKNRTSTLLAQIGMTAYYFPSELLKSEADSSMWEMTASMLAEIQDIADQQQVDILFVVVPSIYQVHPDRLQWAQEAFTIESHDIDLEQPYDRLQAAATEYGIALIDLLSPMRIRYAASDPEAKFYGEVDTHLSEEGHRTVADILTPYIRLALTNDAQ